MSNQWLNFSDHSVFFIAGASLAVLRRYQVQSIRLWFLRIFICAVLAAAALSGSVDDLCLPSFATSFASPPHNFVGIWSKCFWGTLVFGKIPFFSNSRKFCGKIIVRRGRLARAYRAASPRDRPCADYRLPLVAFFTTPPGLAAGMVCHTIRGQLPVFLRMPLCCNLRTQCSQSIFRTNSLSHTIRAVADAADAGVDVHLPFMAFLAFPPNSSAAFQCDIVGRKWQIFVWVPL